MVKKKENMDERRRAKRTAVQESFQLYLVLPKVHGMVRIYLRDISALGLCFRSEVPTDLKSGQSVSARVYINPSFYLPLDCTVIRAGNGEVAMEFADPLLPAAKALGKLQEFLEMAEESAILVD